MGKSDKLTMFDHLNQLLLDYRKEYLTLQMILEDYQGHSFKKNDTVKGNDYYEQLHEALKKMKKVLRAKGMDFDYKNGRDVKDGFRYPQNVEDPMKEQCSEHHKMRTKQLMRLVEKSVGLLPPTWLADFVSNAQTLAKEKGQGAIIDFDQSSRLEHIEHVPTFFNAIESGKQVLQFGYRPKFGEEVVQILFTPHYLKEYNQRWFVFGKSMSLDHKPLPYSICGIERIVGRISVAEELKEPVKSPMSAKNYFKDIIGVTRKNGPKLHIVIEAKTPEVFYRLYTKPLHRSQQIITEPGEGVKGVISIDVIANQELDSQLLSFGPDIKILSPVTYKEHFESRIKALAEQYFKLNIQNNNQ